MPGLKIYLPVAVGFVLMSGICLAEDVCVNPVVNLVCDFDYAELGVQTGLPRLRNAVVKPEPAHFLLQVGDDCPGPFGNAWLVNEDLYYTEQAGENPQALSINRADGSATYLSVYSAKEGRFKILYSGKCQKVGQPLL
jgi:hypothetical protein